MLNHLPLLLISALLSSTTVLPTKINPRHASPQNSPPQPSDPYFNNDLPRFKKEILGAHNTRRREFGVAPLSWDNELWKMAKNVTKSCIFEHSHGPYGENLYGSGGGYPTAAVDGFADEVKNYRDDNLIWDGNSPRTKDGSVIGHYTQVAWKDTVKVAFATSDQKCNFEIGAMCMRIRPRGNIIMSSENLYEKNVGRPGQPFKGPTDINVDVPPYKSNDVQLPESLANGHFGGSNNDGGGGGNSPSPSPQPRPRQSPPPGQNRRVVKIVTVTVTRRSESTPGLVKRALLLGDDRNPTEYISTTVVRKRSF